MGTTSSRNGGSEVAKLKEALATTETQLKEARAELGRLIRVTERTIAEQTANAQISLEDQKDLEDRLRAYQSSIYALVNLMRESDLVPKEVIMSWLVQSEIFDPEQYLRINDDVRAADIDPSEHFMENGMAEGRGFSDVFPERI